MEEQKTDRSSFAGKSLEFDKLKAEQQLPPLCVVGLGEMLQVGSTLEQERKVVLKLDIM